jgi:hypothetical protein
MRVWKVLRRLELAATAVVAAVAQEQILPV